MSSVAGSQLERIARGGTAALAGAGVAAVANFAVVVVITQAFSKDDAGALFSASSLFLIVLVADLAWRLIRAVIDGRLDDDPALPAHDDSPEARRRPRLRTLLPILRNFLLVIIGAVTVLTVLDSLGINSGIEVLDMHMEKLMVYFAMVFAFVLELIQMRWSSNYAKWKQEVAAGSTSANDGTVGKTAREEASAGVKAVEAGDASKGEGE